MIRETDLISYLPPYLAEYQELPHTLAAENPEFDLVWKAADQVLRNEFIATADAYGISRFEKMLHIFPSKEDSLESRRERVQSRWLDAVPYTMKMLLKRLVSLCGETDVRLAGNFEQGYTLTLETSLEEFGKVAELENMIACMLPCNIVASVHNETFADVKGNVWISGAAIVSESMTIST